MQRKPWSEVFDRTSFAKPSNMQEAASRIRKNAGYFKINYLIAILLTVAATFVTHPSSLLVLGGLAASWIYVFAIRQGPLVISGKELRCVHGQQEWQPSAARGASNWQQRCTHITATHMTVRGGTCCADGQGKPEQPQCRTRSKGQSIRMVLPQNAAAVILLGPAALCCVGGGQTLPYCASSSSMELSRLIRRYTICSCTQFTRCTWLQRCSTKRPSP